MNDSEVILTIEDRKLAASLLGGDVLVCEDGTVTDCNGKPLGICKKPVQQELEGYILWDLDYKVFGDLKLVE